MVSAIQHPKDAGIRIISPQFCQHIGKPLCAHDLPGINRSMQKKGMFPHNLAGDGGTFETVTADMGWMLCHAR